MIAYIISDGNYLTPTYEKLIKELKDFLYLKGFAIEEKIIKNGELHFCIGCYGCWTKKPGECMINDSMAQINRTFNQSDVVFYLSPIIFGQFSPNIKNAMDRWLPNVLPFFIKKPDGTTGHPKRYDSEPKLVFIGYNDEVSQEEASIFTNIVKHRSNVEAFIFSQNNNTINNQLKGIRLERINN